MTLKGRAKIESVLGQIFIDHVTAAYHGRPDLSEHLSAQFRQVL